MRKKALQFANSIINIGQSNSEVSLRVRPSFNVGGRIVSAGYITLNK